MSNTQKIERVGTDSHVCPECGTIIEDEAKIRLRHPELDVWTTAVVVDNWHDDNGRFCGQKLRFQGEDQIRHLRFAEIDRLREEDD